MRATILSIGTELVTGQCVDTNSAWLSQQLLQAGVATLRHVTVSDDLGDIVSAVSAAAVESGMVVLTGGLGPTADDLTREALARVLNQPLESNPQALAQVEGFFARWKRPMADSNRVQALIPRGCRVLENRRGTAPGIYARIPQDVCPGDMGDFLMKGSGTSHIFALPGVPSEMKAMFAEWVLPVAEQVGGGARTCIERLACFGMPESTLGQAIADLMARGRNPSVGTTASAAVISVRIVAHGADGREARRLADADVADVRSRLGSVVFGQGDDTLQSAVARLLTERGLTVGTAESCTGGLLAKSLTDVAGSSAYFVEGAVSYSNLAKERQLHVPMDLIEQMGAVSEEVAAAMAVGCRENSRADIALSLTGIAGPSGGAPPDKPVGLVYIGLADRSGVEVKRHLFGEHLTRDEIRDRSCKSALNLLRLLLLGGSRAG